MTSPELLQFIRPWRNVFSWPQADLSRTSAICPLSRAKRTSASDCRTIAIYEYTPWLLQNDWLRDSSAGPRVSFRSADRPRSIRPGARSQPLRLAEHAPDPHVGPPAGRAATHDGRELAGREPDHRIVGIERGDDDLADLAVGDRLTRS